MATTLTDDDNDDVVEFTESVEDINGDTIAENLELDKINGADQTGSDRDPPWFTYSASDNVQGDGTREVTFTCEIDLTGLNQGTEYEFLFTADDGQQAAERRFIVTAESGIVLEEGFESGDLSKWNVSQSDFEVKTNIMRTGAYSGGVASSGAQVSGPFGDLPWGSTTSKPDSLEFYWQEKQVDARGAGWRILNSNGNPECSIMTNNPEWRIEDANGVQDIYPGDGYERWIRAKFIFDWENGTFGYEFEDEQSGTTRSGSGQPLINNVDGVRFQFTTYTSGSFNGSKETKAWMDDILVK